MRKELMLQQSKGWIRKSHESDWSQNNLMNKWNRVKKREWDIVREEERGRKKKREREKHIKARIWEEKETGCNEKEQRQSEEVEGINRVQRSMDERLRENLFGCDWLDNSMRDNMEWRIISESLAYFLDEQTSFFHTIQLERMKADWSQTNLGQIHFYIISRLYFIMCFVEAQRRNATTALGHSLSLLKPC